MTDLQILFECENLLDIYFYSKLDYNILRGLSPRANYTDRATAACR
jgi:hypothetical protein